MTEHDKSMLAGIISAHVAHYLGDTECATSIVQQMAHWPGLASEEGWTIVMETLLADRDKVAAQLAAAQARIAELEEHILTLAKLPTWRPVEDGFTHLCGCIDCANGDPDGWSWRLYVNNGGVGIEDPDNKDDDRWVLLPDDLQLCRFTRGE